jgi:hypothetical protein
MRRVSLRRAYEHLAAELLRPRGLAAQLVSRIARDVLGASVAPRLGPRKPGRHGRGDAFYAALAARYVALHRRGVREPVKALTRELAAEQPDEFAWAPGVESVRQLLNEARKRGFLTPPPPGRAGGELTPKAYQVLGVEPLRKTEPKRRARRRA